MRPLAELDIGLVRADNPGPFTLEGTNTWLIGRGPCWVVDPGPALPAHVGRVAADVAARGGLGGIAITHGHDDHVGAVQALLAAVVATEVPVVAARWEGATRMLADGERAGPLLALATPGHAPDHLAYLAGRALFSGDAVLGRGSVYIAPDPGALRGYLEALERLEAIDLAVICPGHGPLVVEPAAKLAEYRAHRVERERRLLEALDEGLRTTDELLDRAWSDAPAVLRPASAITLAAHLDKLEAEGRLPTGVDRSGLPTPLRQI
ncbi:MAG: MBL fold metallo-hydrolase [Solirubrobacteraceae bacterium]|nr:MBL fold metallo-hydrolase [Solirubrobacteraceae bacterium]